MTEYQKDLEIAKFMGAKTIPNKQMNSMMRVWESTKLPFLNGKFSNGHELKFGQEYNWILPVVQTLELYAYITDPIDEIRDTCYEEIIRRKLV